MTASNVVYFDADNGSGTELWRTDGTAAGTFALSGPGAGGVTVVDGAVYFEAPDGSGPFGPQSEIWRTDGTVAGTVPIGVTLNVGPIAQVNGETVYIGTDDDQNEEALFANSGSGPSQFLSNFGVTPTQLFGVIALGTVGNEAFLETENAFWETNGTAAGTHLVNTGSLSFSNPSPFLVVNGKGFFTAQVGSSTELIETDGVTFSAVTNPAIIGAGVGSPMMLNGKVVFTGGGDLSVWDGVSSSAVTVFSGGSAQFPTVVGNSLYFIASDQQGPSFGSALWVSDGTAAAHEVATGSVGINDFARVGSRYVMEDSALGFNGLFVSDGTGASTALVIANAIASNFITVGDEAYFQIQSGLWESNGTIAGTRLVKQFTSIGSTMSAVNGELLFSASTGPNGQGGELWVSDGTAAGTHELVQIHPSEAGNLAVSNVVSFGAGVAFVGVTQSGGEQLWTSDGTHGGTAPLPSAPAPQVGQTVVSPPIVVGGTLYYVAAGGDLALASGASAPIQLPLGDRFFTPFDGELFAAEGGKGFGVTDGTVAGTTQDFADVVVSQPAVLGGKVLFLGNDFNGDAGLFSTDGTEAGTAFIAPVPTDVTPSGLTVSGSQAFFVAGSAATGAELWVTDGTAGGTHLVEDIAPGVGNSSPTNLTPFDGGVVFDATDLTHGEQVWFSDGTAANTFQLDINQTRDASASLILQQNAAVSFDGKVWFLGNDGVHGDQLFSTDGTTAGTVAVATLNPAATQPTGGFATEGPLPTEFVTLGNGQLLFLYGGVWVSDGAAAGTTELSAGFGFAQNLTGLDGLAFFLAMPTGDGNDVLYVSDGTNAGTEEVGAANIIASVSGYATAGDDLIYYSGDPTDGQGLFAYNALSRTAAFLGAVPGNAAFFTDVGGKLRVGTPADFASGQIWITDGTAGGTQPLIQSTTTTFEDYTVLGSNLYFTGFGPSTGLWVSNGTAGSTREAVAVNLEGGTLTAMGSELYFIATQSNVTSAWAYNPSTGNAAPVASGAVDSIPFDFTAVGSGGFFIANDHTSQGELWHVSSAGAVTELTSATNGEVEPPTGPNISLALMGSDLFFTADDATHGESLFISNGTSVTFLAQVQNATDFSVVGSELYFQGSDATNGAELWVSDGTVAGTHRVTDTETANSANASDFVAAGGKVFFSANDGVHGQELWTFNGQAGGASMVADLDPGAAGSNPTDLTALGADVYFVASNGTGAPELWRSDGTAGGTTAITSASNGASPQDLTAVGSELFFFGTDSVHGSGLFVSGGATATFLGAFSAAADFSASDGHLFFQGTTGDGTELWTSDGTPGGTVQLSSTGFDPGASITDLTSLGAPAAGPSATAVSDFDGNGASDLLFSQGAGAELATWQMEGTAIVGGGAVGSPGGTWAAVGTGDFNDDGKADILFQDASGNLAIWEMNRTSIIGGGAIGNPGGTWAEKGVGDFNGDGLSDILFQDASGNLAIWEMNGTNIVGGGAIGNPGGTWSEKAIGDFNGDGKSDILFQDASGDLAIWEMIGTNIVGGGAIGNPGAGWTVEGTGDFNGDGMSDILFENSSTGDYAIWEMDGASIIGGGDIGNPGANWSFAGIGDYNGDGHADILFTDPAGDLAIWEMNGTQIIGGGNIGNPGAVWHVLGTCWAELTPTPNGPVSSRAGRVG